MRSPPTVSVLIPAYNAAATIDRALVSVWRQDWPIHELVLVDDASTDDTAERARRHARTELRVLSLSRNRGECGAMNEGLRAARGDLVAFLDADDEWLDGKLARQVPIMAWRPDLVFTSCRFEARFPDGRSYLYGGSEAVSGREAWQVMLRRSQCGKPCVLARREMLLKLGGFDESLRVAGDQDMWIRLALAGPVDFISDGLVRVHVTEGSLTHRYARREIEFTLPMIKRHLNALADRLDAAERRSIWAERLTQLGRDCYRNGGLKDGAWLLAQAMWLGDERLANLWYLVTAAPPTRRLKCLLGRAAA